MTYENVLEMIRLALLSDFSAAGKLRQIEAIIAEFHQRQIEAIVAEFDEQEGV